MRQVALYDAKNGLSALVQEVEKTGEEIVITRHGKPAAKLAPAGPSATSTRAEAISSLLRLRREAARRHPNAAPLTWETLKHWMRDEDDDV
ncbi:MAG TPA: type II toxin-antitoxin system prevent-host-death family antitoxin [Caulobacteraceae bacterium]|nr:type II toxin-antitoxin system prevent-host-death family antitoxin [Caulobacteraceae bacterium]